MTTPKHKFSKIIDTVAWIAQPLLSYIKLKKQKTNDYNTTKQGQQHVFPLWLLVAKT